MEGDALVHGILGVFVDGQITAFEDIVEGHGCCAATDDRHALAVLGFIAVIALLGDGIDAGNKTIDQDFTCSTGFHRLVDTVAGYREGDPLHHAVLRGLLEGYRTGRRFHIQPGRYRFGIFHTDDHILQAGIAIGNEPCALADHGDVISRCGNAYRTGKGTVRRKSQGIAGLRYLYTSV